MNRLVVIGSVIADQLMTVPRLPDRGGDVLAGPVATQAGGAFNIAAAAVRLGLPTALDLCTLPARRSRSVLERRRHQPSVTRSSS